MEKFKICYTCKVDKKIKNFHKDKNTNDGYRNHCKICRNEKLVNNKKNQIAQKYIFKHISKKGYHKCSICDEEKKLNNNNFYTRLDSSTGYRKECKDCMKKNEENKKCITCKIIKNINNFSKSKNYDRTKRLNKSCDNCKLLNKINNDVRIRLHSYLRLKNIKKTNSTFKSIKLSPKLFSKWIMYNLEIDNLLNNKYHIDHVIPLSYYKCESYKEVINTNCNIWSNLIPIKQIDNLKKSNRYPNKHEILKIQLRVYLFKKQNKIL